MSLETLVLGWGNPGRGDDGLGPAFVQAIGELEIPGVAVDSDYQLQVEDAAEVARYQRVLFVDADRRKGQPFWLGRLQPDGELAFSTHSVSPAAILRLANDLFGANPDAWILGIRGYRFDEFSESLSGRARRNLELALRYVQVALQNGTLEEMPFAVARKRNAQDRVGELW